MPIFRFAFLISAFAYFMPISMVQGQINLYSGYDATRQYAIGDFIAVENVDSNVTYRVDGNSAGDVPPVGTPVTDTNYFTSLAEETPDEGPTTARPDDPTQAVQNSQPGVPGGGATSTTIRFLGISTRGIVSFGQSMYGGIDVLGSGKKKIAFFGRGASMDNVTNYVTDPTISIYKDKTGNEDWEFITTNDNWGTLTETGGAYSIESISTVSSSQGVTMPTSVGESGIVLTVDSGFRYAAILSSSANFSQEAIIEAYEIVEANTSVTSSFLGISTRGMVSFGQSMYGGIDVLGSGKKKIAFFGRGASMDNVTNYVTDPTISIYKDTTGNEDWEFITTNDNWGTLTETGGTYSIESISTVSSSQGVTMPTSVSESGVVLTVDAGFRYAAILSSSSGLVQEAIIEAYEVD